MTRIPLATDGLVTVTIADQGYVFDKEHDLPEPKPQSTPDTALVPDGPEMPTQYRDAAFAEDHARARDVDALRAALGFLLVSRETGEPTCERSTCGIGSCFTLNGYTADARYDIDRACASCIAHYALTGQDIPTGPGAHADEEPDASTLHIALAAASDLPLSMQPGWDPTTPGREAEARFLDACAAEGVDPRDADPDGHWS